jgi:putative Mg2+ transporter-C (MgtC) family protein
MIGIFAVRLGVALILGASIGLERQWRQRMAGLRTNALVSTGAAIFVMLQSLTPGDSSATRIAAQVVSGIGFLGAGVIMRDGFNVRGLNTAATLWCAAAVGTLSGAGYPIHAVLGAAAALGINLLLRPLALKINQQPLVTTSEVPTLYRLTAQVPKSSKALPESGLREFLRDSTFTLRGVQSKVEAESGNTLIEVELFCQGRSDAKMEDLLLRLVSKGGFQSAAWRAIPEEAL